METLTFNNTSYAINLEKLMEWVNSPVDGDNNQLQSTVTQVWAKPDGDYVTNNGEINDELDLITKEMTDVKSDNSMLTTKFELIKDILNVILEINYNPDGSLKLTDGLTLSEVLCLNTLIKEGIIYEID